MTTDEFRGEVYRPGVVSLSRLVWGSLGAGLLLAIMGFASETASMGVLFPPLAATCFIVTTCPYLRVARPKPVIVGHFIASICGVVGAMAGDWIMGNGDYAVAVKLGLSVMSATFMMQLLDADHPPAAATSAIPSILPLPTSEFLLPFNMAWGAAIAVVFSFGWNNMWFRFPARDVDFTREHYGVSMDKSQFWGMVMCILAASMMSMHAIAPPVHTLGVVLMSLGVLLMGTHHYFEFRRHS